MPLPGSGFFRGWDTRDLPFAMDDSMTEFIAAPSVDLLRQLVSNTLKQSLAKSVRLWVILRSLYGEVGDPVYLEGLAGQFGHGDWERFFFSESHRVGRDRVPGFHDADCACALSLEHWLFGGPWGCERGSWVEQFYGLVHGTEAELVALLRKSDRLFAVTGRSLEMDFESLVRLGALRNQVGADGGLRRNQYCKVEQLPDFLRVDRSVPLGTGLNAAEFIQSDLSEFVESLAQPIQGVQRFYLHTEYIVPRQMGDRISEFQGLLKDCWEREEVPPIELVYESSREFLREFVWVVCPVCVFYYQRAPYLFGYGYYREEDGVSQLQWYDFRLDHIQRLTVLDWDQPGLDGLLLARRRSLPLPDAIHDAMAEVWGFEFYRPADWLLLRFDRYFYSTYIEPTERARLFTRMTIKEVGRWVGRLENRDERLRLQRVLALRSEQDVFCRVRFRVGDRNILMRLRAWGFNVEVLLPVGLRSQVREEVGRLGRLYGD
jgi:CRISPR-associated protein (TIGR03985 family)